MNLTVNVNDAGLHPAVRRALSILTEKGVVTSASVVATGMDVEEAVKLSGIDFGVHLDILRGRPVSHWQEVNSLVNENGAFHVDPVKLFRLYAIGKVDHGQVKAEWRAQIELLLNLGVNLTHVTSHKHVHSWPSLTHIVADLAKEYGIGWVRKPVECAEIARMDKSDMQSKFQNVCGFFDREADDVNWTHCFWDASEKETTFSPGQFSEYILQCNCDNDDVVELCCSPGVTIAGDPPIPEYCNPPKISARWRSEFHSLAEEDWLRTFAELGLVLKGFGFDPGSESLR